MCYLVCVIVTDVSMVTQLPKCCVTVQSTASKLIRLGVMAPLTNENRVKQRCVTSIVTTLIWTMDHEITVTTR